ncbi:MAG: DUF1499 domain-containing protein [Gammaproteobacteria bacterium]|nr:DUF1499 domain-containing protein [Gammaproteobacteria bacterium]
MMLAKFYILVLILIVIPVILVITAILQNNLPLTEMPGIMARLKTYFTSNVAETSMQPAFPELAMRVYPYTADDIHDRIKKTINHFGWELLKDDHDHHELNVIITTPLWRFKDDMLIRIMPISEGKNAVYIRSSSRMGKADLGTNTRHILDFYSQLDEVMQ